MKPLDRELPTTQSRQDLTPEERWLLGEPRPALRRWLPLPEDRQRMARFGHGR